ncbi:hypothetical protein CKM354_000881500 [Cercospora kikuchii]|uniref:Uncharacterized protein n=1 Tax=Cercospora kikuchii TaxID=84275 RepID=A0A9P3CWJ3_9PEZI|nr:uncharacterized protein CKM354_000881500 [Cercospora kikuchii]GIZ45658.1 hypothetical protein CKM354_000881500 [Cercospora kikuchii]
MPTKPSDFKYRQGDGVHATLRVLQEAIAQAQSDLQDIRQQRAELKKQLMSMPKTAKGRTQMAAFIDKLHRKKEAYKKDLMEMREYRVILDNYDENYDTEKALGKGRAIVYEKRVREWQKRVAREA